MISRDVKIKVLNVLYDIKLLTGGRDRFCCDFHDDIVASAKVYDNVVYCFGCRRFYYVYNYIIKDKLDIDKMYKELVDKYGSEEKLLDEYNKLKKGNNKNINNKDIYNKYLELKEVFSKIKNSGG